MPAPRPPGKGPPKKVVGKPAERKVQISPERLAKLKLLEAKERAEALARKKQELEVARQRKKQEVEDAKKRKALEAQAKIDQKYMPLVHLVFENIDKFREMYEKLNPSEKKFFSRYFTSVASNYLAFSKRTFEIYSFIDLQEVINQLRKENRVQEFFNAIDSDNFVAFAKAIKDRAKLFGYFIGPYVSEFVNGTTDLTRYHFMNALDKYYVDFLSGLEKANALDIFFSAIPKNEVEYYRMTFATRYTFEKDYEVAFEYMQTYWGTRDVALSNFFHNTLAPLFSEKNISMYERRAIYIKIDELVRTKVKVLNNHTMGAWIGDLLVNVVKPAIEKLRTQNPDTQEEITIKDILEIMDETSDDWVLRNGTHLNQEVVQKVKQKKINLEVKTRTNRFMRTHVRVENLKIRQEYEQLVRKMLEKSDLSQAEFENVYNAVELLFSHIVLKENKSKFVLISDLIARILPELDLLGIDVSGSGFPVHGRVIGDYLEYITRNWILEKRKYFADLEIERAERFLKEYSFNEVAQILIEKKELSNLGNKISDRHYNLIAQQIFSVDVYDLRTNEFKLAITLLDQESVAGKSAFSIRFAQQFFGNGANFNSSNLFLNPHFYTLLSHLDLPAFLRTLKGRENELVNNMGQNARLFVPLIRTLPPELFLIALSSPNRTKFTEHNSSTQTPQQVLGNRDGDLLIQRHTTEEQLTHNRRFEQDERTQLNQIVDLTVAKYGATDPVVRMTVETLVLTLSNKLISANIIREMINNIEKELDSRSTIEQLRQHPALVARLFFELQQIVSVQRFTDLESEFQRETRITEQLTRAISSFIRSHTELQKGNVLPRTPPAEPRRLTMEHDANEIVNRIVDDIFVNHVGNWIIAKSGLVDLLRNFWNKLKTPDVSDRVQVFFDICYYLKRQLLVNVSSEEYVTQRIARASSHLSEDITSKSQLDPILWLLLTGSANAMGHEDEMLALTARVDREQNQKQQWKEQILRAETTTQGFRIEQGPFEIDSEDSRIELFTELRRVYHETLFQIPHFSNQEEVLEYVDAHMSRFDDAEKVGIVSKMREIINNFPKDYDRQTVFETLSGSGRNAVIRSIPFGPIAIKLLVHLITNSRIRDPERLISFLHVVRSTLGAPEFQPITQENVKREYTNLLLEWMQAYETNFPELIPTMRAETTRVPAAKPELTPEKLQETMNEKMQKLTDKYKRNLGLTHNITNHVSQFREEKDFARAIEYLQELESTQNLTEELETRIFLTHHGVRKAPEGEKVNKEFNRIDMLDLEDVPVDPAKERTDKEPRANLLEPYAEGEVEKTPLMKAKEELTQLLGKTPSELDVRKLFKALNITKDTINFDLFLELLKTTPKQFVPRLLDLIIINSERLHVSFEELILVASRYKFDHKNGFIFFVDISMKLLQFSEFDYKQYSNGLSSLLRFFNNEPRSLYKFLSFCLISCKNGNAKLIASKFNNLRQITQELSKSQNRLEDLRKVFSTRIDESGPKADRFRMLDFN